MINVIIAIVLGTLRIIGVKHIAFQAIAHLYVGGLFTAGYCNWSSAYTESRKASRLYLFLGIFLSILELTCFIIMRKHGQ